MAANDVVALRIDDVIIAKSEPSRIARFGFHDLSVVLLKSSVDSLQICFPAHRCSLRRRRSPLQELNPLARARCSIFRLLAVMRVEAEGGICGCEPSKFSRKGDHMDNEEIAINEFFNKYKAAMWRGEIKGILNARDAAAKDLIERLNSTDPAAKQRFKEMFFDRFLAYLKAPPPPR